MERVAKRGRQSSVGRSLPRSSGVVASSLASVVWLLHTLMASEASAQTDGFDRDAGKEVRETGIELALGGGYATGAGRVFPGKRLREQVTATVPVSLELGYRAWPRWFFGGYGELAPGLGSALAREKCSGCSHDWYRWGVEVQYRFFDSGSTNAWVSLGVGQQWFRSETSTDQKAARTASGPDFLNLRFGSEWRSSLGIAIGPFTGFTLGTFSELTSECLEDEVCATRLEVERIDDAGPFVWFSTGLRLVFLP